MNYKEEYSKEEIIRIENKIYEIVDFYLETDLSRLKMLFKKFPGEERYAQFLNIINENKKDKLTYSDFNQYSHSAYRKCYFRTLSDNLYSNHIPLLDSPQMDYYTKKELKEFFTDYFVINFCLDISWLLKKLNINFVDIRFKDDLRKEMRSIYTNAPYLF